MGFMDDFKRWAKGEDDDENDFEEFVPRHREIKEDEFQSSDIKRSSNNNKVVNINATTQLSVVLVKPGAV